MMSCMMPDPGSKGQIKVLYWWAIQKEVSELQQKQASVRVNGRAGGAERGNFNEERKYRSYMWKSLCHLVCPTNSLSHPCLKMSGGYATWFRKKKKKKKIKLLSLSPSTIVLL